MLITLNEQKTKLRWCGTSGIPVKFRQSTRANRPKRNRKPLDTRVYAAPTQLFLTQIQPLIESVERAHQLLSEASFSSTRGCPSVKRISEDRYHASFLFAASSRWKNRDT